MFIGAGRGGGQCTTSVCIIVTKGKKVTTYDFEEK